MATSSASTRAEYQHFVPQFLLRNFSTPAELPRNSSKRQPKKGYGNEKIHHVDLTTDELAVEVVPVRRVMGMNNMYEDLGQATPKQRRHVEELFGRLEGESSRIFRRIIKGVEDGNKGIWLPREDRNVLRRFLFLLMYRSSQSHRRFYHATRDEYKSEDEVELHQYMLDRGFDRPVGVWFDNLKAIAECKMDAEGQWMQEIQERMYPPDARWFCHHTQQSYMAICCPEDTEAEFLLAENSYSVYDGIDSFLVSPMTGEQTGGPWVGFHYFAPVSPRIVIILRSNILPLPEEDINDEIRGERDQWRAAAVDQWFGADRQSTLADLPITKARNNYTELTDGQLRELKPHVPRSSGDRFFFKFFRINKNHVSKINSFMLDGARSSIVFASPKAFTRTLEWYMTDTSKTWKNVVGRDEERCSKVTLLRKLSAFMKSLGSNAEPVWKEGATAKPMSDGLTGEGRIDAVRSVYQMVMDDIIQHMDREAAKNEAPPTPFLELYTKLGGFHGPRCLQDID